MTTHDQQNESAPMRSAQPEFSEPGREPVPAQHVSPEAWDDTGASNAPTEASPPPDEPLVAHEEASSTPVESPQPETVSPSAEVQPPSDELLFDADTSGLRSRWDDIQAVFVDDPAKCVQKADTLVAEVVEQVTAGFSEARSRLEAQWAKGEQASTEDLRLALQRYREFFQRLLAA
ncbi:hypothetical protein MGALJ_02030 [Mycobacterium gallinarum]|uniref:Uncharacterized protein n=1 Tax=Mycobacterium gallinarum TaxID=39689 RepID=A0A9W4FD41_9MYCO|nr:hypothetical protein [Mycobacterium gallinarum]BBY90534.1 hypothetical protein MGALJ_02030 [Mycobacterium gallinarum]